MRRLLPTLVLGLVLAACDWPWPLDNPLDPNRCSPACSGGSTCLNGRCVTPALDAGPDARRVDAPRADAPWPDLPPDLPLPEQRPDLLPDLPLADLPPDLPKPVCGNGVREHGEDCDKTDLGSQTCKSAGFTDGTLACASGCKLDTSGCYLVSYTARALVTQAGEQTSPAIASDGTDFLVVWEYRPTTTSKRQIHGVRIDSSGKMLDTTSITIADQIGERANPAVAYSASGKVYLVTWEDNRLGSSGQYRAFGARVSPAGKVLDAHGKALSNVTSEQTETSVASNGTDFFVVWADDRNALDGLDIYGTKIYSTSVTPATSDIAVVNAGLPQRSPAVGYNGTHYLVVWESMTSLISGTYDVRGARISSTSTVTPLTRTPLASGTLSQRYPSVASDGTSFLVLWQEVVKANQSNIWGNLINASGAVVLSKNIPLLSAGYVWPHQPGVYNGTSYDVLWAVRPTASAAGINGARLTKSGGLLIPPPMDLFKGGATIQSDLAAASNGSTTTVVWNGNHSGTLLKLYVAGLK
jgi:hypothetical protein